MVLVGYSTSQTPKVYVGTVGGTASARTVSFGTGVSVDTKTSYYGAIEYDSNVDRYVVGQWLDNSGGQQQGEQYYYVISVSGTAPTIENSGGTKCFSGWDSDGGYPSGGLAFCFDANENRMLLIANGISDDATNFKVMCQTVEITTTGINGTSNTPVILDSDLNATSGHAQSESQMSMVYNPDTNKILIGYIWRGASDADSRVRIKIADVSSTSVSLGTKTTVGSVCGRNVTCGYDENLDKFCVIRDMSSTSPYSTSFYNMTVDGSDNITLSAEVVVATSGTLWTVNNNFPNRMAYAPTAFSNFVTMVSGSGVASKVWSFQSKNETTTINLDSTNYLGVASTSASTTEKVNINLPELSINNSQTGLTVGEDYFSDTSGTVRTFVSGGSALSEGQYLGKALSTTALELKETPTDIIFGKASNTIAKGNTVLVEADGDFAKVTGVSTSFPLIESGVQNIATSGANDKYNIATNGAGVVCAVWEGTSNYPYCAIGNVTSTGSTLTWGSPVALKSGGCTTVSVYYSSGLSEFVGMHIDTSEGGSDDQFATKIEFSGTTATCTNIGGATGYGLGSTSDQSVSFYDSTEATGFTFYGKATSKIMLLTDTQIESTGYRAVSALVGSSASDSQFIGLAWDQTNNVGVAWWRAEANSDYPTVRAFTVSGTGDGSITMGTAVVLESNGTDACGGIACGAPNSSEFVAVWKDSTTELRYNTMTLVSTTITAGTAGALPRVGSEEYYVEGSQILTSNPKTEKYYFVYNDSDDDLDIMVKEMSYSSGSITVDSTTKVLDGTAVSTYYWNILYTGGMTSTSEASMVLIGKRQTSYIASGQYSPAYTGTETNLTAENFIGFADTASSANETSKVKIIGLDVNQSGLTAGQKLYVQNDGTLSETAVTDKVVDAGQAISSTKINIKG